MEHAVGVRAEGRIVFAHAGFVICGVNFELALFLAKLTGAAIYGDQRLTRDDLAAADPARWITAEMLHILHPYCTVIRIALKIDN